jgi:hypothetical protein
MRVRTWGANRRSRRTRFAPPVAPSARAELISRCRLAPERGEPRLLAAGLARWAEIVIDQGKAAAADQPAPCLEAVEAGVAAIDEALFVLPARVGGEQHAVRLQRSVQPVEDVGHGAARDVEQDGVGEYAIEARGGKVMASRSCCQTSQPETVRAMATNSGQPSSPTTTWPRSRKHPPRAGRAVSPSGVRSARRLRGCQRRRAARPRPYHASDRWP